MTEERKAQYDTTYMQMAMVLSQLSYCIKKKVGAILVKDNKVIATGFNGSPARQFPNNCEDENGKTLWHTIHAESNAITSVAASTQNCTGATMYITCSPCKDCAKLIYQSGIVRVLYLDFYKDLDGVDFLKSAGIEVVQFSAPNPNNIDLTTHYATTSNGAVIYKPDLTTSYRDSITVLLKNKLYEHIDKSIDTFLVRDGENFEELRHFLILTKDYKEHLKNRPRVYVHFLKIANNMKYDLSKVVELE